MKLVIVESPTKAKTIGRFLGNGYIIKASMGHVMDLPKSTLGVDIEHNFTPQYEISPDKKQILAELKKLAKDAEYIILATDPDREGEAISAHIAQLVEDSTLLVDKKHKSKNNSSRATRHVPIQRIVFHEITKHAIENALLHPGSVNTNLVNAQTARRVLDRLVGYKLSPVLWQKVRRGLSAGRVQSVALRLIVEREREIEKFVKEEYWTVTATLSRSEKREASKRSNATDFELIEINAEKIETSQTFTLYDGRYKISRTTIVSEEQAKAIADDLQTKLFTVAEVLKKETRRSPQPPFTTSALQQEAARRFGYSGKRTMSLAQKLYEEGFITYHRTDSVHLSSAAVFQMRNYVEKEFGKQYIPEKPRFFSSKQKLAQEAHEAIRPTNVGQRGSDVDSKMGPQYEKLYELIWRRAVASQMSDALIESTTVMVDAGKRLEVGGGNVDNEVENWKKESIQPLNSNLNIQPPTSNILPQKRNNNANIYRFKTTGSVLLFDGFLKINPFGLQDKRLPQFIANEQLQLISVLPENHETSPPPRYNDASLIGSLEEAGIGRPSTYASIISTIEARNYIERQQGKFIPTPVGIAVNDFLVKNFSHIDDIPFTAQMEDELDAIANGGKQWVPVIKAFYDPFEKKLEDVKKAERVQIAAEETGEMCPQCGSPLVVRVGRFGKFISCKNFPACNFKKPFIQETNFTCPKDGGKIITRKTRKGRTFYGCANYPACDFAVWKLQDLKKQTANPSR